MSPLVFAPEATDMYPAGFATHVEVEGITTRLGRRAPSRPFPRRHHRRSKIIPNRPRRSRLFRPQRLSTSLGHPPHGCRSESAAASRRLPLIRDADGLALSSRNIYLTADQRRQALALSRSVAQARDMFSAGERDAKKITEAMRRLIGTQPDLKLDYAAVVDPLTLAELTRIETSAVALVAARIGNTHLIDNEILVQQLFPLPLGKG